MNVNLIGVGAGYSYVVSGPTHQCYEDITLMRAMPNFRVLSPADHFTSAALMDVCMKHSGPKYLRLDAQILPPLYEESAKQAVLKGFHVHLNGDKLCLVATGYMMHTALKVAALFKLKNINIGVIDIIDFYGFDKEQMMNEFRCYQKIISLEEGFKGRGGMDALLFNLLNEIKGGPQLVNIGVRGEYSFELGTRLELHELVGIGPLVVERTVEAILKELK